MEQLPFTKLGFMLYEEGDIRNLTTKVGLKHKETMKHHDSVTSKAGDLANREYYCISFTK